MAKRTALIFILLTFIISCTAPTAKNKPQIPERLFGPKPKAFALDKKLPPPPPVVKPAIKKIDPLKNKTVTINAVDEPISRILFMIASDVGMNLVINTEIDIKRKVTLNLNDSPARQALEILMDTTGLYYTTEGNVLRIKSLITKEFKIPYIHTTTQYKSSLGGDIIGGASENESISGEFSLKYDNPQERNDLYRSVAESLKAIIFAGQGSADSDNAQPASSGGGAGGSGIYQSSGFTPDNTGNQGYFLNIFTGRLFVRTTKQKMQMIEDYLDRVLRDISKQVLIEARLVEIVLDDSHAYGIDWSYLTNGGNSLNFNQRLSSSLDNSLSALGLSTIGTITDNSGRFTSVLSFLARHGEIETLGNPRVRVMNGQSAVISSGNLIPYWERSVDEEDTETGTDKTVSYDRITVLDGIMLGVTPHIHENGEITMNIVPVSSSVESDRQVLDENNAVAASFPVINLKEAGSILKVRDGETIVMGGLINNKRSLVEEKVPFLGDIPVLGFFFRNKLQQLQKRELVIFLRTTVIDN